MLNSTFKFFAVASAAIILAACGDSKSNSGGPVAPPAPALKFFATGTYDGTRETVAEGNNIDPEPRVSPFRLSVIGAAPGAQQVRVAFLEYSGTSLIQQDGSFSVPSGNFRVSVVDRNDSVLTRCLGAVNYSGVVADNRITGTMETTRRFVCDNPRWGPIVRTATFDLALVSGKLSGANQDISVRASN